MPTTHIYIADVVEYFAARVTTAPGQGQTALNRGKNSEA